jgi:hypothetical protein
LRASFATCKPARRVLIMLGPLPKPDMMRRKSTCSRV